MLLLHTVLAVTYSGLLVSALSGGAREVDVEDVGLTDDFFDSYRYPHDIDVARPDDGDSESQWTPGRAGYGQFVMDAPYAAANGKEGKQIPFPDIPHPGPPGHDFPAKWPTPDPQRPPKPPSRPPAPHEPPPGPPVPPHHPSGPHHHPPAPNLTIYQTLESNPRFSRIFKLVNYTEDITKVLNDSSSNVTFFALPDWAFPKPPRRPPHRGEDYFSSVDEFALPEEDSFDVLTAVEGLIYTSNKPDEETIKKILKYILSYQILPSHLSTAELGKNLTHATSLALSDGSLDGEPLRIRVAGHPVGGVSVNVIARVVHPNIPATNGLIHVVNRPVLPPPSIFQTSFFLQKIFSALTSALQRVELTDALEWRNVKGPVSGSPAVTFFAPNNEAFARLPRRLRLFLFSPFGEKALKKLLQFHVVPEFVLHSNYLHNASSSEVQLEEYDSQSSLLHNSIDYSEYDLTQGIRFGNYVEPAYLGEHIPFFPHGPEHGHFPSPPPAHPFPPWVPHERPPRSQFPDQGHEHEPPHHPHHPPWVPSERPSRSPFPDQGREYDRHPSPHHPHCPPPPPVHFPVPPPHYPPPPPLVYCSPPPPPPDHFSPEEHHEDESPHRHRFPGQAPEHGPHPPPPPPLMCECESRRARPFPHPRPHPHIVFSQNTTAPTLLGNHSLHVHVVQSAHGLPRLPKFYQTAVFVHGVRVVLSDVPARNGVIHVVDRLLNPLRTPTRGPHHPPPPHGGEGPDMGPLVSEEEEEEDEWAGWEEWLPAWADEE